MRHGWRACQDCRGTLAELLLQVVNGIGDRRAFAGAFGLRRRLGLFASDRQQQNIAGIALDGAV
ncbi:MAG TPA: hypothetical protein VGE93_18950 [Bryobacteraceae bacterium]